MIIFAAVLLALCVGLALLALRVVRPRRYPVAIAWRKGADGMAHPSRWLMPNGDIWEIIDR